MTPCPCLTVKYMRREVILYCMCKLQKTLFVVCLAVLATGLALGSVAAQDLSMTVDADDTVAAGEELTVEISAENVGSVTVDDVPSDWSVSSSQNDDAFINPESLGDEIENEGSVVWAWEGDRSNVGVSVTFAVPEDAQTAEQVLSIVSENSDGDSDEESVTVAVQGADADEDDDETGMEDDGNGDEAPTDEDDADDVTADDDGDMDGMTDEGDDDGDDEPEGMPGFTAFAALVALLGGYALRQRS